MNLPRGKNKEQMIDVGAESARVREDELRLKKEAEDNNKLQIEREEFDALTCSIKKRIEDGVLVAINNGKRETSFVIMPDYAKKRHLEAWQKAVKFLQLAYSNEYEFDLHDKRLYYDNACEAANVDGVSHQEWTEDVYELTVKW